MKNDTRLLVIAATVLFELREQSELLGQGQITLQAARHRLSQWFHIELAPARAPTVIVAKPTQRFLNLATAVFANGREKDAILSTAGASVLNGVLGGKEALVYQFDKVVLLHNSSPRMQKPKKKPTPKKKAPSKDASQTALSIVERVTGGRLKG